MPKMATEPVAKVGKVIFSYGWMMKDSKPRPQGGVSGMGWSRGSGDAGTGHQEALYSVYCGYATPRIVANGMRRP
jgi:hypothetical protein